MVRPDPRQEAPRTTPELLSAARARIEPVLRGAVDALPPGSMRTVAGYHLGWWDSSGRPCAGATGKSIRPALVLGTARALGGDLDAATAAAAAVELAHAFSLLHDDVFDKDLTRHGRPAAWTVFGTTDAILAGNTLLSLAVEALAREDRIPARAVARLCRCIVLMCEGESTDSSFENREQVHVTECLTMTERKTAVLFGCCGALGALAAGVDERVVDTIDRALVQAGIAFQYANDLLGIWGDPVRTGRPIGCDLKLFKKSLPVVDALHSGTTAGYHLSELFRRSSGSPLSDEQARDAADLVAQTGAGRRALLQIHDRVGQAHALIATVVPDPHTRAELDALVGIPIAYYASQAADTGPTTPMPESV